MSGTSPPWGHIFVFRFPVGIVKPKPKNEDVTPDAHTRLKAGTTAPCAYHRPVRDEFPHGCLFWAFGVPLAAAGTWILVGSMVAPERVRFVTEHGTTTTPAVTALLAVVILVVGAGALTSRRWPDDEAGRRTWAGAAALVIGTCIAGIGLLDPDEPSFPSGRWAAIVAGMVIVGAGALAIVTHEKASPARARAASVLAAAVFALFGVLFLGLAFGERLAGGGEITFLVFSLPTPWWLDRAVLALVGALWIAIALTAWRRR